METLTDNIYDILREALLPTEQVDAWAELVKKHANLSRQELRKNHGKKDIEVNASMGYIKIGKKYTIKIIVNQ